MVFEVQELTDQSPLAAVVFPTFKKLDAYDIDVDVYADVDVDVDVYADVDDKDNDNNDNCPTSM